MSELLIPTQSVTVNKLSEKPLLPSGEGWDEGIKKSIFPYFYPLTPALSRRERESRQS